MRTGGTLASCFAAAAMLIFGHAAGAQVLPGVPITLVVPFPPGASADTLMRIITKNITDKTGQVFVVDNRAGAGGSVGATSVKQAAPNGHTLLQINAGSHAILTALQTDLGYDPVKDFSPITLLWSFPHMLVVPADNPAKSVKELIEYSKTRPDGLSFASPGIGSGGHILGEMLKNTGARLVHVPYRGMAPVLPDLVAGRTDMLFGSYASVAPFIEAGKLRPLGLAGRERLAMQADVPTMAQAGYPDVDLDFWFGLAAPAGTPAPIINRIHKAFSDTLTNPAIVKQMADVGVQAMTDTPAEFAALIASDGQRLRKVLERAGIQKK
jgi:tripartite-type tricarboxylate transporter receptor subunit TctC